MHAEMPQSGPGIPDPRGLQLWVDLPKEFKMVEPSYQELGPTQYVQHTLRISSHMVTLYSRIPEAYPQGKDGSVKIRVISGKSHGVESPVRPLGGCWYFHVIFNKPGTIFQEIREYFGGWHREMESSPSFDIAAGWTTFLYSKSSQFGEYQLLANSLCV